ncbi:putative reverse transcriptase domain-containing protein [Tanacetum coccineum]
MCHRMRTRSAGRHACQIIGRGTVYGLGNDQGIGVNGAVEGVNGNVEGANEGAPDFSTIIAQQLQNLLSVMLDLGVSRNVGIRMRNCGNENVQEKRRNVFSGGTLVPPAKPGEVVVSMSWNDFKFMMIQEFCPSHEMQKLESELWNHAMVGAGHAAYTDRFHELARLVPYLVTPESRMIERYVYGLAPQIRGMVAATEPNTYYRRGGGEADAFLALTIEAVRNGSIKKVEKRGNMGEPSKDRSGRDDNKRTRTGMLLLVLGPCRTCFNCNRPGHLAKDCRGVPRNVNPVNARNPTVRACYECGSTDHFRSVCPRMNRAQGPEENRPNQVAANNEGQGHENQGNRARGRTFMLGAEEARQDSNIVTGTFTLNNYFATTLFDSGVDYSFVSTTFIPLLGIEPASTDWLANYKTEIICHEESSEDTTTRWQEIFLKVFPDDLSGLPPIREIEFRIELIPGETPLVARFSLFVWAPSELYKLLGQLIGNSKKKVSFGPSSSPEGASRIDDLFDQMQGS